MLIYKIILNYIFLYIIIFFLGELYFFGRKISIGRIPKLKVN